MNGITQRAECVAPREVPQGARLPLGWSLLLGLLLLPGVAACQKISPPPRPVLNPNPKHVVRITGRIPPSLEVTFAAGYSAANIKGECKPRMLVEGFLPLDPNDYHRSHPLEITRNGEHFETRFVVDKYLPGKCGWKFEAAGAGVVKDGNRDEEVVLPAQIAFGHLNTKEPYCTDSSGEDCPITDNSDATPVIVRCRMFDSGKPGTKPSLMCQDFGKLAYKETHIVTDETKSLEVNFYDLSKEPDPISEEAKEAFR